jgi:hypothetical protein
MPEQRKHRRRRAVQDGVGRHCLIGVASDEAATGDRYRVGS